MAATFRTFYAKGTTPDQDILKLIGLGLHHVKLDSATREMTPFTKEALANFTAQTRVIYGEKDNLINATQAVQRAKTVIPNLVAAEIVAGQGHFMGEEVHGSIYGKVIDFLNSDT